MLDPSLTLFATFQAAAKKSPGRDVFTFLGRDSITTYTYRSLFERCHHVAGLLQAHGLDPRRPLGILLDSQEGQVVHYLASLASGLVPAILTPPNRKLDRAYYLQTMRAVLAYCQFGAVITDVDGFDADARTTVLRPYTLDPMIAMQCDPLGDVDDVRGAAFLQFSSGTTGIKRGVLVDDRAVLHQLNAYAAAIGLTAEDRIVSWLPLYHDMGFITTLNTALACGVHSILLHPLDWVADPVSYLKAVTRFGGTLSWHPNFAFSFMARAVPEAAISELDLASLRGLVNCSEPVTRESQERFTCRFGGRGLRPDVFWGCYAMAETTFALTHGAFSDSDSDSDSDPAYYDEIGPAEPRSSARTHVCVGRPISGVLLNIVDDSGNIVPDRHVGELWVQSPFNLTGYYNNPRATSAALVDGWYRTGDLGYRVGDHFYVTGRKKDLLVIGGINVYPQDVEECVSQVADVLPGRAVAFAEFDPALQTERMVIVTESNVAEDDRPSLALRIRQRVAAALQVTSFDVHVVGPAWLIKSTAGKIARSANRDRWRTTRAVHQ